MQNDNIKNQNQQLPTQVAAVSTAKSSISVNPKRIKMAGVKATLYHLDGDISEINLTLPNYSSWSEFLESGLISVREYVYQLSRHWIKISHFTMVIGSLKNDGSINGIFEPKRYDIPLDKVYKSGSIGKWLNAEQHPNHPRFNQRGSSIELGELMRIIAYREETVYNKIDDNITQCGVPSESRGLYFNDGDIPSGEFMHKGILYLVVYSFIKTANEGGASC